MILFQIADVQLLGNVSIFFVAVVLHPGCEVSHGVELVVFPVVTLGLKPELEFVGLFRDIDGK